LDQVTADLFFGDDALEEGDRIDGQLEHALGPFFAHPVVEVRHLRLVARKNEATIPTAGSPSYRVLFQHGGVDTLPGEGSRGGEAGVTTADHGDVSGSWQRVRW
jgi:hypothetical protein